MKAQEFHLAFARWQGLAAVVRKPASVLDGPIAENLFAAGLEASKARTATHLFALAGLAKAFVQAGESWLASLTALQDGLQAEELNLHSAAPWPVGVAEAVRAGETGPMPADAALQRLRKLHQQAVLEYGPSLPHDWIELRTKLTLLSRHLDGLKEGWLQQVPRRKEDWAGRRRPGWLKQSDALAVAAKALLAKAEQAEGTVYRTMAVIGLARQCWSGIWDETHLRLRDAEAYDPDALPRWLAWQALAGPQFHQSLSLLAPTEELSVHLIARALLRQAGAQARKNIEIAPIDADMQQRAKEQMAAIINRLLSGRMDVLQGDFPRRRATPPVRRHGCRPQ